MLLIPHQSSLQYLDYAFYLRLKGHRRKETLSLRLSIGWWIMVIAWTALVILSSLYNIWSLPIDKIFAVMSVLALPIIGIILTFVDIFEFHSLRKISGIEVSNL